MTPGAKGELTNQLLESLEAIHHRWLMRQGQAWACREGCASCCTRSVTATALEARRILAFLAAQERPWQGAPAFSGPGNQTEQPLTTNQLARLCLDGTEPPEPSQAPWNLAPCPFLTDKHCAIYPVRPLMCRAFVSLTNCAESGEAMVPPMVMSGNTVFLQLVEHLGQGQPWGNLLQLLDRLSGLEQSRSGRLLRGEPLPGFLVAPEEQAMLDAILTDLSHTMLAGMSVWQWLQQGVGHGA
ncbi:MAG: YkgJ family cysteine cluster protein [Thermodesulfobacteriota bacterium]